MIIEGEGQTNLKKNKQNLINKGYIVGQRY